MALRKVSRTADEQNALIARFGIAQDKTTVDLDEDIARKYLQGEIRQKVLELATIIDIDIENSQPKSVALTKLEEALMWAGKAIFA